MLETVREYGLERLAESGEEAVIRDRHAVWCLGLAEQYREGEGPWVEDLGWLSRVEAEHDNVRAALAWLERTGDVEGLLRLAGATQPFWDVRGHRVEAVDWLERALTCGEGAPPRARLHALAALGRNLQAQGYYARARGMHEELLALAREHNDAAWEAGALNFLGLGALNQERYDEATPLIEGAMAAYQRLGDRAASAGATTASESSPTGGATSLSRPPTSKPRWPGGGTAASVANLTAPLNALGLVACDRGDHWAAAALLAEGLTRWEQDGSGSREILAEWLAAVARLAACRRRAETAGRLYGAAEALFDAVGQPLVVPPRSLYRRHVEALRNTMGADVFAAAWAAGRALPLEQAVEEARAVTADPVAAGAAPPAAGAAVAAGLTPRETEVLRLIARGPVQSADRRRPLPQPPHGP